MMDLEHKIDKAEQKPNFVNRQPKIHERLVDAPKRAINYVINSGREQIKNSIKPALPPILLNAMWLGSSSLAILKDALTRSELNDIEPVTIKISELIPKEGSNLKGFQDAQTRYVDYSVFPTYPTRPVELTESHKKLLKSNMSDASKELQRSAETSSPLYIDLSAEAITLLNETNLTLIHQHLEDIATLANNSINLPDLSHLGMNYFENEVYDTLSRGLSFVDKNTLREWNIVGIPVKQPDGKFTLKEYTIDRFNLSGDEKKPDGTLDHNKGHPIFFLKPIVSGSPPLVVARGTLLADDGSDGAEASVQADRRKDMSLKWIMENPELQKKMSDLNKDHGPLKVCGHSLGGNIATVLSVRFYDMIDSAVAIGAPQVSEEIYHEYKKIPESMRPNVINLLPKGDPIPGGGKRIIGMAVQAEQQGVRGETIWCNNPIERHLKPFNNNNVRYSAIDKRKEINKGSRALATFNITLLGSENITQLFTGTGGDKALKTLSNEIDQKISQVKGDSTFSNERLSPANFLKWVHDNKDSISGDLFLKLYISLNDDMKTKLLSEVEQFKGLIEFYNSQKD